MYWWWTKDFSATFPETVSEHTMSKLSFVADVLICCWVWKAGWLTLIKYTHDACKHKTRLHCCWDDGNTHCADEGQIENGAEDRYSSDEADYNWEETPGCDQSERTKSKSVLVQINAGNENNGKLRKTIIFKWVYCMFYVNFEHWNMI